MSGMARSFKLNKSTIEKDKLCDGNFDKLVIDTSHRISQKAAALEAEVEKDGEISSTAVSNLDEPVEQEVEREQQQVNQSSSNDNDDNDKSEAHRSDSHNRLNQPKRPMNAFMVWGQAIRRELHHRFSNVQNAQLSKALGRVWKSLDNAEKEPYIRKANLIKANHKRDYPNYKYQPRRVEERRTRGNMLIGINLNHPVNQHPSRQTTNFNMRQTFGDHLNQVAQISPCHHHHLRQYQTQSSANEATIHFKQQQRASNSNFNNGNNSGNSVARDFFFSSMGGQESIAGGEKETKLQRIDGVQTFEYHPYEHTALHCDSTNLLQQQQQTVIGARIYRNNTTTTDCNYQTDLNCPDFGQQQVANKMVTEFSYPLTYHHPHEYAYNTPPNHHPIHHQQHLQQQFHQHHQPFAYEMAQQSVSYLEQPRVDLPTGNNNSGSY